MTQAQNQFNQSAEKGMLSLGLNYNSIPVVIDSTEAATLVYGQGVKIKDVSDKAITVVKIAADTDAIFGFIPYVRGKASFVAGDALEISAAGNVVYLEASAAIAKGVRVMPVITGSKVATATTGKSVAGIALDKSAADGDLVRVLQSPAFTLMP